MSIASYIAIIAAAWFVGGAYAFVRISQRARTLLFRLHAQQHVPTNHADLWVALSDGIYDHVDDAEVRRAKRDLEIMHWELIIAFAIFAFALVLS